MKVLILASEAVPLAKTGGMADVVGALAMALARLGHDVRLVLPRYQDLEGGPVALREIHTVKVPWGGDQVAVGIEAGVLPDHRVAVACVRYDPFFARSGLYGEGGQDYPDNLARFALFCRAALQACRELDWAPDILHAHDWQTALAVVYLKTLYPSDAAEGWTAPRTLFTIHNMGYQGLFPAADYVVTGLSPAVYTPEGLEFYGQVNLLKGGLIYADFLNTVSPTYAQEIQTAEFGYGLEGVLQARQDQLCGILNGLDYGVWNPQTDPYIDAHYTAGKLAGKRRCKAALRRALGLPQRNVPLLGLISRLVSQKGIDLILDMLPALLPLDVQVAVLGNGEAAYENALAGLGARHPEKLAVRIGFDERLAHRIEAGADMFLMPSRYEPCGLNQLYSLRYGTVPIVRATGGLADTVIPYLPGRAGRTATGFVFQEAHPEVLLRTSHLALQVYRDPQEWVGVMRRGMRKDFSWAHAAKQYVGLYHRVLADSRPTPPAPRPVLPRARFREGGPG